MKKLFFFLTLSCTAQSLSPTLSEPFSYPGSQLVLSVVYSNNNTSSPAIAGFNWSLSMPAGFTLGNVVAGPASTAAQKTVTCNPATFICIAIGGTTTTFGPGVIANIPIILTQNAPLGAQQISLTNIAATSLSGVSVPTTAGNPVAIQVNASTGTTPWFSASVGQATCRASKVAQTPLRITWVCFNSYGANSGSYTADLFNGGNGTAYFNIGINSIAIPTSTLPDENLMCSIQINATQNPVTMLNGVLVPANSAAYSCSGFSMSGSGTLSWP